MSVSRKALRLEHIAWLNRRAEDLRMTTAIERARVLAGTGKTGSRRTAKLTGHGLAVHTAARRGADVRFDWQDPATYGPALSGIGRVYLVTPFLGDTGFTDRVRSFLDLAAANGTSHVTFLSAYGMDQAPPQVALRAVELDLMGRGDFTHSILRPAWFMQNFSEGHLMPVGGLITVPTGNGTESFVDAGDVAAVAAATLADPDAHAGVQYALTGAEAMTVSDAAEVITAVTGQSVKHNDIDRETWIQASVSAGVPADYADMLRLLTETIAPARGARPTGCLDRRTAPPPTR